MFFLNPKIKSYLLKQTKCSGKTFCIVLSASPGFSLVLGHRLKL